MVTRWPLFQNFQRRFLERFKGVNWEIKNGEMRSNPRKVPEVSETSKRNWWDHWLIPTWSIILSTLLKSKACSLQIGIFTITGWPWKKAENIINHQFRATARSSNCSVAWLSHLSGSILSSCPLVLLLNKLLASPPKDRSPECWGHLWYYCQGQYNHLNLLIKLFGNHIQGQKN